MVYCTLVKPHSSEFVRAVEVMALLEFCEVLCHQHHSLGRHAPLRQGPSKGNTCRADSKYMYSSNLRSMRVE